MASIVSSELAPSGPVRYSLGNGARFELGGSSSSYKTDDASVIAQASVHPWLTVEREAVAPEAPTFRDVSVDPKGDVLSAQYEGETAKAAPVEKTVKGVVENVAKPKPAAKPTAKDKD